MYAEIHAKTNFSFLEGASHPDELVGRAAELGYAALAITDRNSLAGVVRAHAAAKDLGLKLLIGAEITPEDALPLVLWATDRAAYGRLAQLITCGRRRAPKGHCQLTLRDVAEHAEGLLAGVIPHASGQPAACDSIAHESIAPYRAIFGDRCYLLAALHRGPDDRRQLARLASLARRARVPLVAAGDVHYHLPERRALHDVLTAIRHGCTVAEATAHLFSNAQRHLRSLEEIATVFSAVPDALRQTLEIAARCTFSLSELRYEYPEELAPTGQTPLAYLTRLAWAGARRRYPQGVPEKVRQLVEHELRLIAELRYEAYFLTVWDLVRFARRRGILCQGRGSAANSAVCYCLGVTSVDPERMDLLFERFVSRERNEAPDIDVDFEHERREEVLQYLYEKYGRQRAGMTAEVITYRPRSAVRDVGKALGLPADRVDALAKNLEHFHDVPDLAQRCREVGLDPESAAPRQLVALVGSLIGFPRHLSQHSGGMVITHGPLCEMVPIENAAMPGRTVIEWNKDDLDELGILKVDCLALGMLTAIRKCFQFVRRHGGPALTLGNIPPDDRKVYAMIRRADTMGVFQIESRAQMSMLPRIRPRSFYDLVVEVAIVRPGPIQGDMVHPYLRRRNGEEPVTYPSEAIRGVLEKTLGVPLFQEQAMRLAIVAAGFTPGEADQLRRAMGAWRRPGLIDHFHQRLIEGMRDRGLPPEYAEAVFQQIRGFGDYGFPESHAASFALLVYVSAWLKCHHMAAFTAALLNSQPLGFYAPAQLVRNAREHGVEVRPVDVNHSEWDSTLEQGTETEESRVGEWGSGRVGEDYLKDVADESPPLAHSPTPLLLSLRLGFRILDRMAAADAQRIEAARQLGPFRSVEDFARRTQLGRAAIVRLANAAAFGSLDLDRRGAIWQALAQDPKELPLFDHLPAAADAPAALPRMSAAEEVLADYRTAGFSLESHPLAFLRLGLDRRNIARAEQLKILPKDRPVSVAGIVLVRQRPGTAKGITFVTLEDETGQANLIIRPDVWNRYRQAAHGATLLLAHGRLQREQGVIHVLVTRLENLSAQLSELGPQSRDFS
jgi:error-prone DNA polymerase